MTSLYAALDEPNADVDYILGLIADWYADRGDDCDDEGTAATFEEAKAHAETAYRERLLAGLTEVPQ